MMSLINEVQGAMGSDHFLELYVCSLMALLFLMKEKRKAFVIPGIIITFVVVNPVFYNLWNRINDYAYWRTVWMIPVIPVCAAVTAVLVGKAKENWIGFCVIVAFSLVFVLTGTFIYKQTLTSFSKAENTEKLPNNAVMISNALLELDDAPSVVVDGEICIYLRQCSGKIRSLYSRDIYWGSASTIAKDVYNQLTSQNGDLHKVAVTMLNYDYEYLVSNNEDAGRDSALQEAGFDLVKQINEYGIYRVTGKPTEIRTYNEKHQVATLSYVDDKGNPINNSRGFSTVSYEYNRDGRIIEEYYYDAAGNPVLDTSGKAGYQRVYDRKQLLIKETWIGTDKKPIVAGGYSIRTCEYNQDRRLTKDSFYDAEGRLMLRTDQLYAERTLAYDDNGNVTSERYYGLDGQLTIAALGYAGYDFEYDEKSRLVFGTYIGADNKPMMISDGYCSFKREYDDNDNLITEYYFDENGECIPCNKGYAGIHHVYDEQGRKTEDQFLDSEGNLAVVGMGYSKCRFTYTDSGEVSLVYYLDDKDKKLEAGSGFLHEYLQSLKERNISIFIVAKDEASGYITETIYEDLKDLGFSKDLRGQYRKSYYAAATPEKTVDEISDEMISFSGRTGSIPYSLTSAGWLVGNTCSIQIDGKEYAKNVRGLNIVVFDNDTNEVLESIAFDTCAQEMTVTR